MAQGSLVTNYIFVPTISLISIYQTFCFTQLDMWEMNLLPHIKCHKVAHELSFCVDEQKESFFSSKNIFQEDVRMGKLLYFDRIVCIVRTYVCVCLRRQYVMCSSSVRFSKTQCTIVSADNAYGLKVICTNIDNYTFGKEND